MADEKQTPEQELKSLASDLKNATAEVRTFAEKAQAEVKELGKMTQETKAGADKALFDMNAEVKGIITRITEVEQKIVRRPGGQAEERKTLGQMVIDSKELKALKEAGGRGSIHMSFEAKDITSGTGTVGTGVSPATSLVVPERQPIVNLPDRRFFVRDLITPGETISSNIEYPVETTFTNAAATVAEGAAKAQSNLVFDLKSAPVRTIAHFMRASRQILDDAPQLRSYIDGRLRYGLNFVEEAQMLLGDGTGQNLLGIQPQATAYSAAFAITGETAIDRLRMASLQATLALYPSTGFVLHPTDWAKIELTKDAMGRYIVGNPSGSFTGGLMYMPMLWGLPVVATQAQTVNNFLSGAFKLGAQIFDRMQVEVLISTEDQDNFIKNLITIRGEERLALAVYRPAAFVTGTLP